MTKKKDQKKENADVQDVPPEVPEEEAKEQSLREPAPEEKPVPKAAAPEDGEPEEAEPEPEPSWAEQLEEYKDKYLRLAAEFDNFRKRSARQFETVVKAANDDLLMELMPIFDTFELALKAAQTASDFDSFHQGVEMIYRQFEEVLKKRGLKRIETEGQPFDPNFHEAVRMVEQADTAGNMIVEEVQSGYLFNDRVLRAAKVVVSK